MFKLLNCIKKDFFEIPISIRIISLSLLIFMFGRWLGADTFFSVYIKYIVDNLFRVSVIWWILAWTKLLFSIPIWQLDNHSDLKSIILLSKFFYIISWFLYFFAGIFHSIPILIIAVILNGFANPCLFNSYQTLIRKYVVKKNNWKAFWLFFSSINLARVLWALISAILIKYIQLPYLFLFIVIFSFLSILTDKQLPSISKEERKKFLWKESFIHQFFRNVFSLSRIKKCIITMKDYPNKLYNMLWLEFLFNVLNYLWIIFIPILALKDNLSLSQIAIIFAIMRLPYLIDFFTWEFIDKYNKKKFILIILLFLSFLYMLLWYAEWFSTILIITFVISLWLSLIRPAISWLISDYANPKDYWTITGVAEFFWRLWDIFWSLWFWILSVAIWIQWSFIIIWIILLIISISWFIKTYRASIRKT
jgi:MFS family permease